jgi:hypothetical protein
VGFVVDKVALGQVFSEYFGFPCQTSFHQIFHHHNHPGRYNRPFSGRRAEWTQFGLHPPLCELKKIINIPNIDFSFKKQNPVLEMFRQNGSSPLIRNIINIPNIMKERGFLFFVFVLYFSAVNQYGPQMSVQI